MRLPIVKYGDVFSIPLTNGYGFIQCVKETPETECETIRVIPGTYFSEDIKLIDGIVNQKELFFSQIPIKYAINKKLLNYIGNFLVPSDSKAPRFYREEHSVRGKFIGWYIIDSKTLRRKLVKKLSNKQQSLSEWGITTLPDLVAKIENEAFKYNK